MSAKTQILLIDDDEIYLFTASYSLKRIFPEVEIITSKNGEDALVQLEKSNPGIVFLDINMPVMDGWEFLDVIMKQQILTGKKIYLVTSSIDPKDRKQAANHPMKPIIVEKPLTEEKILELELEV